MTHAFLSRTIRAAAVAALAMSAAACTMKKQEAPGLTGPSEFSQSITVSVSPDVLTQDGSSQSVITVVALGPNGEPLRQVSMRVELHVNGTPVDFGSLSARNLVTNAEGRASAVYTAPSAPAVAVDTGTLVDVVVWPIGSDFNNASIRTAAIRLVPPGVVIPPDGLRPYFTFSPSSPLAGQTVVFQACSNPDQPCAPGNNPIVSYSWDFGDGRRASGQNATHDYALGGSYAVTLTVSDQFGRQASTVQQVTVGAGANPTAAFVVSPTAPLPSQTVFFNASQSRPAPGRTIVNYSWDFGDGASGSGVQASHAYAVAGTYTVVLNVTDDAGLMGTATQTVTIGVDAPTANFSFAPASPTAGTPIAFNGTTSTAAPGRTITSFTWNFGDGTSGSGGAVSKTYTTPGTYNVTLTVVDSAGQSGSTTRAVTVQ